MKSSEVQVLTEPESATTARPRRTHAWLVVVLITAAAAALRLYKLGEWSFWVDEMFTLRDSLDPGRLYHGLTFPLSYVLIGASIHSLGVGEWSARIVPAVFGIATPAMVYILGRRSFGEGPSILAAAVVAISPWHIYWSQMARFYTMTVFFSTASLLALHRALEENRMSYAAAAGGLMILAALSHYSALLILAAAAVYVALIALIRWPRPRGLTLDNLLLFFLPFLLGALVLGARAGRLLTVYARGHPTGTSFSSPLIGGAYAALSTAYRLEPTIAVLTLVGLWLGIARRDRGALFLACAVFVPGALLAVSGAMSHAENRYAFVVLPPAALLAGSVVYEVWRLVQGRSRVLALAVPVALALPLLQHDASYFSSVYNGERWNYRAAAEYLRTHAEPGEVVYSSMNMPLQYYLKDTDIVVSNLDARTVPVRYPPAGSWLVVEDSTRGTSAPQQLSRWIAANCDLVAHFPAGSPVANYGLSVYRVAAGERE